MLTINNDFFNEMLNLLQENKIEAFKKVQTERNLDINSINQKGQSFLFSDVLKKPVVEFLIEEGINIHHVDNKGRNALFYSNIPVMKILLKKGVNVNQVDNGGDNYLLARPRLLTKERVSLLYKHGIDMNHVNHRGENVLFFLLPNPYIFEMCAKLGTEHKVTNKNGVLLSDLIFKNSQLMEKYHYLDEFKATRDKNILLRNFSKEDFSHKAKNRI